MRRGCILYCCVFWGPPILSCYIILIVRGCQWESAHRLRPRGRETDHSDPETEHFSRLAAPGQKTCLWICWISFWVARIHEFHVFRREAAGDAALDGCPEIWIHSVAHLLGSLRPCTKKAARLKHWQQQIIGEQT